LLEENKKIPSKVRNKLDASLFDTLDQDRSKRGSAETNPRDTKKRVSRKNLAEFRLTQKCEGKKRQADKTKWFLAIFNHIYINIYITRHVILYYTINRYLFFDHVVYSKNWSV
jgi:hypothetical protein